MGWRLSSLPLHGLCLLFIETTHQDSVPSWATLSAQGFPQRVSVNEWNYEFQAFCFYFLFLHGHVPVQNLMLYLLEWSVSTKSMWNCYRQKNSLFSLFIHVHMDFKYLFYTLGYIPIFILLLRLFQFWPLGALSIVFFWPLYILPFLSLFSLLFQLRGPGSNGISFVYT